MTSSSLEYAALSRCFANARVLLRDEGGCHDDIVPADGYDQVWVGSGDCFPTDLTFVPVRYHTSGEPLGGGVDTKSPRLEEDRLVTPSDHRAPGFSFRVVPR